MAKVANKRRDGESLRYAGGKTDGKSLPYAKPQKKKSFWSLTGFWRWLSQWPDEDESMDLDTDETLDDKDDEDNVAQLSYAANSAARKLSRRGQEMQREIDERKNLMASTSHLNRRNSIPSSEASQPRPLMPRSNIDLSPSPNHTPMSREWLQEKAYRGEDVKAVEILRIMGPERAFPQSRIQTNSSFQPNFHSRLEGLRFTLDSSSSAPTNTTNTEPTKRTLPANPNGQVHYRGFGSARASTPTRYRSSNFGPPPQTGNRENKEHFTSSDGKRRKIVDARSSSLGAPSHMRNNNTLLEGSIGVNSSSSSSGAGPGATPTQEKPKRRSMYAAYIEDAPDDDDAPPTVSLSSIVSPTPQFQRKPATNIFASQPTASGSSNTTSQFRSSATPRRPSPLRQSIQPESPPPSPPHQSSSLPNAKSQTSTPVSFELMTDIIKTATNTTPSPAKPKLNVTNPYQSFGHVRKIPTRKIPAPKLEEPPKEMDLELPVPDNSKKNSTGNSFLDYLDASAPQPGKRPREQIDELEDKELSPPSAQKARYQAPSSVVGLKINKKKKLAYVEDDVGSSDPVEVEEVHDDEPISAEAVIEVKPSEVIEPSGASAKSFVPSMPPKNPFAVPSIPASKQSKPTVKPGFFPKEPSPLRQSFAPADDSSQSDFASSAPSELQVRGPPPASTALWKPMTREELLAIPVEELPTFSFSWTSSSNSYNASAREAAMQVPVEELPTHKFHFKLPLPIELHATGSTTIETSALVSTSDDSGFNHAARSDALVSSLPTKTDSSIPKGTFNWDAAGLKPPSIKSDKWLCQVCDVKNPSDKVKCLCCESPKPVS